MDKEKDELQYSQVGDIRIKEPKKKKLKKKAIKKDSDTPIFIKILVWFMFLCMFLSFAGPLLFYFLQLLNK